MDNQDIVNELPRLLERDIIQRVIALKVDLLRTAAVLDQYFQDVNKAKVVGGSFVVCSSLVTITCAVSSVTLFPAALAVVVAAGTVGGVICGFAGLCSGILEKRRLKQLQARWSDFEEAYQLLMSVGSESKVKSLHQIIEIGSSLVKLIANSTTTAMAALLLALNVFSVVNAAINISKGKTSRAGDCLRSIAAELDAIIHDEEIKKANN